MADKDKLQELGKIVVQRAGEQNLFQSSLSVAYYVTLSFFPILICVSAIIPYFEIDIGLIGNYMDGLIPEPVLEYVMPFVENLLLQKNVGVLSVSLLISLWSASRCLQYVQNGVDLAYGIKKAHVAITSRIFAVIAFMVLMFLIIIFMVAFTVGEPVLRQAVMAAGDAEHYSRNVELVKWGGTFTMLFIFFAIIYYIMPDIRHRFRHALPGALLSALLVLLMVHLYTWYLNVGSSSLTAYGVISAFFVLLIWIRVLAFIVLLGALLNAVLFQYKNGEPQVRESRIDNFFRDMLSKAKDKVLPKGK